MAEVMIPLWIGLLFGGPILSFVMSLAGKRVSTPMAFWLTAGAAVVFSLSLTPVSLPGHDFDPPVLGLAYGSLCVAIGALPNEGFQRFGALVLLMIYGLVVMLLAFPPGLSRTVFAGCERRVRFESWGSVSDSGIAAVLLWQPPWTPIEVQLDRHAFRGSEYPSIGDQEALEVIARGQCGVDIWYRERLVWRAR